MLEWPLLQIKSGREVALGPFFYVIEVKNLTNVRIL